MRLILVRHGETEHNRARLTLGRADVPLNARGAAQAEAVAATFTHATAAVYSSPLARALDTARAIASRAGVEPQVDAAFIEMDVGALEHLTAAELRERHPEFLRAWFSEDAATARMERGETLAEVQERAWEGIGRLREAHGTGEVVVVTHNFVILATVCRAIGLPLWQFRRLKHALGGRTVIDITAASTVLRAFGDTSHMIAAGLADDHDVQEGR